MINGKQRYIANHTPVTESTFVPLGKTGDYEVKTSLLGDAKFPPREYYTLEYLMEIGKPLNEVPLTPLTPPPFSVDNLMSNLQIQENHD